MSRPAHHPVDVHVGVRLRQRRTLLGLNQSELASAVGLAFQQIQKYENGKNRVSASRLYEFAVILGVPVTFFFEAFDESAFKRKGRKARDTSADSADLAKRETLLLVQAYYKIGNPEHRRRVADLVMALARNERGAGPTIRHSRHDRR